MTINLNKAGIAVAVLLSGFHFLWASLVATGWAQPFINFVLWLHMIKPFITVDAFSWPQAAGLLLITALSGYLAGAFFALIWNRAHR